jgi:sulfane dehydrogenase subunit SoxC
VEVSADGGQSWAEAALDGPILPKALTRFRLPWKWSGGPAVLQSRATDEKGELQPSRAKWKERYHPVQSYHMSAIQSWNVTQAGEVSNVFA